MVLWAITIVSTAILYWIYDGYGRALLIQNAIRTLFRRQPETLVETLGDDSLPSLTVLLTVHNEAAVIRDRIENLLQCDYPSDRLSIVVASDGSTDETNAHVRSFSDRGVRLH